MSDFVLHKRYFPASWHSVGRWFPVQKLPKEKQVPIIGIGGIATWQDAVEFIMAGATAIQVGTNTFANPNSMIEIIDGLKDFMKRKGFASIEDFRGCAL